MRAAGNVLVLNAAQTCKDESRCLCNGPEQDALRLSCSWERGSVFSACVVCFKAVQTSQCELQLLKLCEEAHLRLHGTMTHQP